MNGVEHMRLLRKPPADDRDIMVAIRASAVAVPDNIVDLVGATLLREPEDVDLPTEHMKLVEHIDGLLAEAEAEMKTLRQNKAALVACLTDRIIEYTAAVLKEKARIADLQTAIKDLHERAKA